MKIRYATAEDCQAFWKAAAPASFRGIVAEKQGGVVGIGGVYFDNGLPIAWTEFNTGMTRKERALGARLFVAFLDTMRGPVYAFMQDDLESAKMLLPKLGFEKSGIVKEQGELYIRHPKKGE